MTHTEQTAEDWRTESLRRARAHALTWAERADDHQVQANDADASVRAVESDRAHLVTRKLERDRYMRALHTEQSDRAARLADMWANVARAFT